MSHVGQALVHLEAKWARLVRRFFHAVRGHLVSCSSCDGRYRQLKANLRAPNPMVVLHDIPQVDVVGVRTETEVDSDVLSLKISVLGDCHIGKTSFMTKCVGDMEEQRGVETAGLNLMDKIFDLKGARIAFRIWEVEGDDHLDHVPVACKDAVAVLIMFDLTNRCTLNNAISWYQQARRWNKTAIPVLIGTKFDDFVQLPLEMQWAIVNQARACARAMKATLFFSSATHNINVNKIFKFVVAKLFNLPWTVERNLNIGEPTIDF
ncbi:septum-promoting GTP-binding protein 1-like [Musa acuminata AAA Group]|uniref:septum-promoting GTP-binding protein 1 n=1 Tax=Musa acuminata AAA Group TaxID=214697 RepID=UPI0031DEAA0A